MAKTPAVRMNVVDRVVGFFNPEAGLRRAQARVAQSLVARQFDAARPSRFSADWVASSASANSELLGALSMLRHRSRDLVRNNPYAARAIDVWTYYLVGDGIRPKLTTSSTQRNKRLMRAWKAWAETTACDVMGKHDFYGLQSLAVRSMRESGEVLIRRVPTKFVKGSEVPAIQLMVIEADQLDESKTEVNGANRIIQGIEIDANDRIVAYWIYPTHPGDALEPSASSIRVPATEIVHLFVALRPGQTRGYPVLTPVILQLRDLQEYREALLMRAKIEACFTAWVSRPADSGNGTIGPARIEDGDRFESLEPGMINYLKDGESVSFPSLSSSGAHNDYTVFTLQAVAVGAGIPYYELSGDLKGAGNYSSIRAGTISFRRAVSQIQWHTLIPAFGKVWAWFCVAGEVAGLWGDGDVSCDWMPPRFEMIDPLKDLNAEVLAIRAGLTTLGDAISRQGYDPDEKLQEMAETTKKLKELGLFLDTDPSRVSKGGQVNDTSMIEDQNNG